MKNSGFNRKIGILDWLIFLSIIIMIIMVYVPLEVWQEESKYKTERRNRMKYINFAEEFYFELTGKYTTNVNELFSLVESATDSLLADTTFIGKQIIFTVNNKLFNTKTFRITNLTRPFPVNNVVYLI